MASEILCSKSDKCGLWLDPRTKLILLITIATFVLGGLGGDNMIYFRLMFSTVPLVLLIASRNFMSALVYILIYTLGILGQTVLLPITSGFFNFIILAISGILCRFLPSVMMGYFVVSTTTVSEFVASMERIHVTNKIVIPMSVMFRFFPTVGEEYSAINDAMRMRGVNFGGANPIAMFEYRIIPMMICSVKIGEELSAAALTRGLGAPTKRTNICKIGFKLWDVVAIVACIFAFVLWFLRVLGLA